MSEKIGRRPPGAPTVDPRRLTENTPSGPTKQPSETSGPKELAPPDTFERPPGHAVGVQLKTQLQALAKGPQGKVVFTNEELAYLANTFAALIRQHPKANRAKRAKLFTKAILKGRKRLGKLLEKAPEEEAEALFAAVADALDGSPVLAQLVEDVTDEVGKLNG